MGIERGEAVPIGGEGTACTKVTDSSVLGNYKKLGITRGEETLKRGGDEARREEKVRGRAKA